MLSLSLLSRIGHVSNSASVYLSLSFETIFDQLQTEEIMGISMLTLFCRPGAFLGPVSRANKPTDVCSGEDYRTKQKGMVA